MDSNNYFVTSPLSLVWVVTANSQKVGRKKGKRVPVIQITPADVVEKSLEKPKSFKSRVNEYDTDETIPSLDDTSIVVQQPAKRGRREYNNLDQSSIITTTSRLRSSKKKKS